MPYFDVLKKRGLIDEYWFMVRNGYSRNSPSVIIMIHFTSASALMRDRARDEAIEKEVLAKVSEEQGKAAVANYQKYRKFLDDALFTEVTVTR